MKGLERRIECTFLIFVEKVSFLPADTSVETELGRHPQGFKEICTKCRM